jgi:hypothetical protein
MASRSSAGLRARWPSGIVEGLNNNARVIQRRAYGLRDEEYLRLKVLTSMLDPMKSGRNCPLGKEKTQ